MLHYKAVSRTRRQKLADIVLIILGLIAAAYTTIQTLKVRRFLFFSLDIPIFKLTYFFGAVNDGTLPGRFTLRKL
jgi:hypothetical protein